MARNTAKKLRGFSLTEVTIALGVVAFALTSVVGLLGVALGINRSAGNDTLLVSMSTRVLSDLRSSSFDALWLAEPRQGTANASLSTGSPADSTYFFTNEGALLDRANAANSAVAFVCRVIKTPDPATRSSDGSYNKLKLQLTFSWSPSGRQSDTQTFHASIARY